MHTVVRMVLGVAFGIAVQFTVSAEETGTLHEVKGSPKAAEFNLPDMNDKKHKLADYRGKVLVVNFWATWCPPCREEFPSMEKAYQKLKKQDIEILAIDVGEDSDTIFEFTSTYPVTFPLLLDFDAEIVKRYGVVGLPTTFIIDGDGKIRYQVIGAREWDDPGFLHKIIKLKKKTP